MRKPLAYTPFLLLQWTRPCPSAPSSTWSAIYRNQTGRNVERSLQDVNLNPQIPQVGNFLNTPDNFTGGKISEFHKQWKTISMSNWLFSVIEGVTINEDKVELISDKIGN